MLDWTMPLQHVDNMHAGAVAIDNAQNQKFYDVPDALQTTEGPMNRIYVLPYLEAQRPSLLIYQRGAKIVFAVAGIQGGVDALETYRGWLTLAQVEDWPGKVNSFAKRWYDNSVTALLTFLGGPWTHMAFFGHSFGSTTATIMANRKKRADPECKVWLGTYGAPRFGDATYINQVQVDEWIRVHNYADPVPYMVPSFTEAPLFNVIHTPSEVLRINSMRHMTHGYAIKQGQPIDATDTPRGLAYPLDMRPASLRTLIVSNVTPHLTNEYVNVLEANRQSSLPRFHNVPQVGPTPRVEPGVVITPKQAEDIADYPDGEWPKDAQKGNVPGVPVEPPILPANPIIPGTGGLGIKIKHRGKVWLVEYHQTEVYRATSKRDARGWAKALRAFVTQYQQNPNGAIAMDLVMLFANGLVPQ